MKPILIIDCDPDFRRLLSQLLQREGYLVIQASNLNDARRILVDSDPLVVATSLALPDGNGFELLDYVHEKIPGTPSLVFSNYGYDILGESVLLHGEKNIFVEAR